MDGVLIDSGPLHQQAWELVLGRHRIIADAADFRRRLGMRDTEVMPRLIQMMPDEQVNQLAAEKSAEFQRLVRSAGQPVAGAVEFLTTLRNAQVRTGVASLATIDEISAVLDTLGITNLLEVLVTRSAAIPDKPAPDIFLQAMQQVDAPAAQTVIFEDAIAGVEAARLAGGTTVALTTSYSSGELSHADLVVADFFDQRLPDLFIA